ncbi:GMC family oxidoreductase N-terminal domain-containing protein [Nocardioides montaniterrae]
MAFSEKQIAAMRLIADTFVPGTDDMPAASETRSVDFALRMAERNPRAAEVKQLKLLLAGWNSRGLGLALTGKPRRFSDLPTAEREAALRSLRDSRIGAKRALFCALKGASIGPYYMAGGESVWDAIGYPAPPGVIDNPPAPTITPVPVTGDVTLDCDVVIVGSGAGGGTVAGVLSEAGLDVIVLEAGQMHDERDFDGSEEHGFGELYAAAPAATTEGQMMLLAGAGLGGGTVVNYSTSFRTPDHVRKEWAGHGVPQFDTDEYAGAMDAVYDRLGVNSDSSAASSRDAIMERGAAALDWPAAPMPRNVKGCDQGIECGRCGLGCRIGAKQSTAKTWLADAAGRGSRILTDVKVRSIDRSGGRASGVTGRTSNGHTVTVRARAVVAAAGAIQTPALLQRSGLTNPNIGKNLRLHPATAIMGVLDERVEPWTGGMQTRYVDQLADLDGEGYGVIFETASMTPGFASSFIGWRNGADHLQRMKQSAHIAGIGVLLRDKDSVGTVKAGKDGEPVVRYTLSPGDTDRMLRGFDGAAQILEAAGAHTIYSPHQAIAEYFPGKQGSRQAWVAECRRLGFAPGKVAVGSFHILGSARMGGSPTTSAVDPDGQAWDLPGLYVMDGACFPTASGVNPMISIESIAYMSAKRLAAKLA